MNKNGENMRKGIKVSVLVLMLLITTGCGKTTLTCTYDDQSIKYEIKDGKIISVTSTTDGKTTGATEEELEQMAYFNSDANEETVKAIKDTMGFIGATCK